MLSETNSRIVAEENQRFITKVFGWMFAGLAITGMVAYFTATSHTTMSFLTNHIYIIYIVLFAEIFMVYILSERIEKFTVFEATLIYLSYAALNGFVFSIFFIIYTKSSIATTFYITAGTFGFMSFYGYVTKKDLTSWGNLLFMALLGLIIASVVNIFLRSSTLYWVVTFIGIITFVGLIAYDTQKIKEMNIIGNEGTDEDSKEAIIGALELYLDFINLFLYLLRIFGKKK